MNIDYSINLGKPSAAYLFSALRRIIESHPEINFHQVGVSLNDEYSFYNVSLHEWEVGGKKRIEILID